MNQWLVIAAAAADTGESKLDSIVQKFGLQPQLFFSQLVVFIIVAILLNKFAYKPILAILEERRQRIQESLDNAEKIKKELAEAERTRKEILEKANQQADRLIQEARDLANNVRESETRKAIDQAEEIVSKAREASEADHARMLEELKREVGQLVVQTTAQVVGRALTEEDQKRLVDAANKELAA